MYTGRGGLSPTTVQPPTVADLVDEHLVDLNRLAREVTALHAAPAAVAIFRSSVSSDPVYRARVGVYAALSRRGQHVDFITDHQVAAGKLHQYTLVVIPAGEPMAQTALPMLEQFLSAGGSIVTVDNAVGDSVLTWDDHGQPLSPTGRARVLAKAVPVHMRPDGTLTVAPLTHQLDALGLTRVSVIDSAPHQPVYAKDAGGDGLSGWEWRTVTYQGHRLVNLVAYSDAEQAVYLEVDGRKIERAHDLISGMTVAGPVFHLHGMTPYLLILPR